ncbi:MAG: MCE family protein [Nitriliruptorales bacterium]|nr:MCE family protein [Nitriliruptorales bacterium]
MISRRIIVNVLTFIVLGSVLTYWVIDTYLGVGFGAEPFETVLAEFEESPGLRPDYQVSYLGHDVGLIGPVTLEGDRVVVELRLNVGEELPQAVTAAVRRRSAVGEPYVNLEPKPGTDPGQGPRLGDGDRIPIEDTSVPLSYEEVFAAVDNLLSAVNPEHAGTLVRELAAGLEGTSETFRSFLVDVEDITSSFAENRDELQALTDELTALTRTFASQAGPIGSSIDSLDDVTETLASSRELLVKLTEETPALTTRLADLFSDSRDELSCVIDVLADVGLELGDDESAEQLEDVFNDTQLLLDILADVESIQPDGSWLRVKFFFNDSSGNPTNVHSPSKPFPEPPAPQQCDVDISEVPGLHAAAASAGDAEVSAPAGERSDSPVAPDERSPDEEVEELASSESPFAPSVINPLLALPLLALIVLVAFWRPWRLLGIGRTDG